MIWYSDKIGCKESDGINQCKDHDNLYSHDSSRQPSIEMVGEYNHPGTDKNIIEINLSINSSLKVLLFYDNPSFLITPDDYLDPELIKQKYYKKIIKFKNIISNLTLPQIIQKYK